MMPKLEGKLALITGGNSGIGLATAKAFVAEGARVAITGRDPRTLQAAQKELGRGALVMQSDVGDLKQIDELFAQIKEHFGALDILFANAGIGRFKSLADTTEEIFDQIFDINVKGVFFTVQKAIPLLRPGASIILDASIGARIGRPSAAAYAASKAAVRTFARNFSADLAPLGIRVNAVSPGMIATPIWTRDRGGAKWDKALEQRLRRTVPADRLGAPEEVAQVVVFLASDDSRFMLGSEIVIDGGTTELPAAAPLYRSALSERGLSQPENESGEGSS
jgi:NAD(P)-dependent dehydrogenase (short-subunit alcohol dehydrogenase family)